jgi:hypothetical protein
VLPGCGGEPGITLSPEERSAVLPHLMLLALEEGANCDEVALASPADPLVQIYAVLRKTPAFAPADIAFPGTAALVVREYDLFRHEQDSDALFVKAFFVFLANHLWDRADRNGQWLRHLAGRSWPCRFLCHLDGVARDTAAALRAGHPLALGEVYASVSAFARPEFLGNRNIGEFQYGVAAARAVMVISFDLLPLQAGGAAAITRQDVEKMFDSEYCFHDRWISQYVASRRRWLNDDALEWVLAQGEQALAASIGEFPERAERYAWLAALAASHGRRGRAEELVTRAAGNLLARGYHKDMILGDVLHSIRACRSGLTAGGSDPGGPAAAWIGRLAPPIARITEFTDGDETGNLPKWLADAIAEVAPELLPAYYLWLADGEEYGRAEHAFEVFVRTADLTNPVVLSIAQTATDDACVRALAARSREGNPQATEALSALTAVMGLVAADEPPASIRSGGSAPLAERPKLPPPEQYPPEKFADFLSALRTSGYWAHDVAMAAWAEHWAARGRGRDAQEVLVGASERGHTSSASWAIYRLAARYRGREDAYRWLVRAYRELNGWSRYFASDERAAEYWEEVKKHYGGRWAEILGDTILGGIASRGPAVGSASFERLVAFCVTMGQRDLAHELVEEMVTRALELVSPVSLPVPEWVASAAEPTGSTERHLPMLFSRLTWPSPLARERACTAIARLFADRARVPAITNFFLRWLRSQHCESVCGLGLLILLRAKMDAGGTCPIPSSEVRASLPWPSLQSSLLLADYDPDAPVPDEPGAWHSGDPPPSFTAPPFFGEYVRNFLPPVYDYWAGEFERRMLVPFRRQWAYEWETALQRHPITPSVSPLRYWLGHREEDERCVAVNTPLSEVYLSAYLRTLAWAVDTRRMDRDIAADLAADTVPIDLELWPLCPGARPHWWPTAAVRPAAPLETAPGDIWPAVGELWRRQDAGEPNWGADWVLARADGRVRGGETLYDLSVLAFFQRPLDAGDPDVEDVFGWCSQGKETLLAPRARSGLRFAGTVQPAGTRDVSARFEGWGVLPVVGHFRAGGTASRWQWWRGIRGLWGPARILTPDGYDFRRDGDTLLFESGGEGIARWTDWTEELRELLAPETLPATGHMLLVRRDVIERCAAEHLVRLCWVVRLTAFCRQQHYELYRPIHDYRVYGVSRIVLPD